MRKIIGACAIALTFSSGLSAQTVDLRSGTSWAPSSPMIANGGVGVKIKGVVENATVGPASISNAAMSVWTDPAAVTRNVTMKGLFITGAWREGIRINGTATGVNIEDFYISMRDVPQTNDQLPSGITVLSGKNVTISRGTVSGFKTIPSSAYPNGDGIAAEKNVDTLSISDVSSSDNTDGGFDLKSTNTRLNNLSAARNYRSYRFWGKAAATTLTSVDPRNAHIWAGAGSEVVIDKLVAQSKTNALILYVDGAKSVTIKACELSVPVGTKLVYKATAASVVTLGKGCVLP